VRTPLAPPPPPPRYWMGTDVLGREPADPSASRAVGFRWGSVEAELLSVFIGTVYGAVEGYAGAAGCGDDAARRNPVGFAVNLIVV